MVITITITRENSIEGFDKYTCIAINNIYYTWDKYLGQIYLIYFFYCGCAISNSIIHTQNSQYNDFRADRQLNFYCESIVCKTVYIHVYTVVNT